MRDRAFELTLGEGGTPLLVAGRLASELGLRTLWIKDEGPNPTGTFKARGLAVSRAWELGTREAGRAARAAAAIPQGAAPD